MRRARKSTELWADRLGYNANTRRRVQSSTAVYWYKSSRILRLSTCTRSPGTSRAYDFDLSRCFGLSADTPFRFSTLWIVAVDSLTWRYLRSSFKMRRAPNRRFLSSRIHCSHSGVTLVVGEECGRRLRLCSPASPYCSWRRSHRRRVVREIPQRLQTRPALCVSWYKRIHAKRVFVSCAMPDMICRQISSS